jgi:ornithine cyclodeaminase
LIHFSDSDVASALDGVDLTTALREAFVDIATTHVAQQPRARTDAGSVKLSTMGAVVLRQGVAGAKAYTTLGGQFNFVVVLFSARTGRALATFDAGEITRRRTAAVSMLAAQHCGLKRVDNIVVFGTGTQGRAHAEAFAAAYPRAEVQVLGRNSDDGSWVEGAQIIITATRAASPLFDGSRVGPGTFVAAVGSSRPDARELDDTLMSRAHAIIVEWREQTCREAGDLVLLPPGLRERLLIVELGEVIAGNAQVRESDRDIVVFKAVGVGLEDVVVAGVAYRTLTGREP